MRIYPIVLAVCLALPAAADTFRSSKGLTVSQSGADRYTVSGVPSFGPADYWCSIGEYAQRILRLSPETRIYVVGDYQRGQRTYTFAISPSGTASEAGRVGSTSIRVDGANRRLNSARAECRNRSTSS
ncbi:MAG: hypothetical protein AAGG57_05545 [Pseudomonadota bacterium]